MAGSKLEQDMEISHVMAIVSTNNPFGRPLGGLETLVHGLARL